MNYKTLFTFLFAAILALSAVSALTVVSSSIPANVSSSATSMPITFLLNNTDASNSATVTLGATVSSPTGSSVSFSPASGTTLLPNQSVSFTATVSLPAAKSGSVTGQLTATSAVGSNATLSFSVPIVSATSTLGGFCRAGQVGNLSLSSIDISSDGEDDDVWLPLDTVKVEVEVSNDGANDLKDIYVDLGLFDSAGRNNVNDLEFSTDDEESIKVGTIKDGDEETVTFEFKVPADVDFDDYQLKVKAYKKSTETTQCADNSTDLDSTSYQSISIEAESDEGKYIAFDNVQFNPTEATCGDTVTLSFDAYNVGENDEDQVKINVDSRELNIRQSEEIKQGLDQGDSENLLFTFTVPQNLADKSYVVELSSEYDYRNGVYRQESDDAAKYPLKIFGCSVGTGNTGNTGTAAASISAALGSDAEAGEELTVITTITNRQATEASFVIDATGYKSWADLTDVSDRLVTLSPGESAEVTLTFDVSEDAAGQQKFTVVAQSGEKTTSKDVIVELAAESAASSKLGNNGLIWIIAIINVVLLIAIILVAIKLARN